MTLPPVIALVTLGVRDVPASAAFYKRLGWPVAGEEMADFCVFRTAGAYLALYERGALARDVGQRDAAQGFGGVALAVNVDSPAAVDAALEAAVAAGGDLARPPEATEWGGYAGYFLDPDGHAWEVAHNPVWPLDAEGRPQIPD